MKTLTEQRLQAIAESVLQEDGEGSSTFFRADIGPGTEDVPQRMVDFVRAHPDYFDSEAAQNYTLEQAQAQYDKGMEILDAINRSKGYRATGRASIVMSPSFNYVITRRQGGEVGTATHYRGDLVSFEFNVSDISPLRSAWTNPSKIHVERVPIDAIPELLDGLQFTYARKRRGPGLMGNQPAFVLSAIKRGHKKRFGIDAR